MDVRCPQCETIFRVDPAKVPPAGVRARCSVCASVFFVGPASGSERPVPPPIATPSPALPPPPPARRAPPPAAPPPPPAVARTAAPLVPPPAVQQARGPSAVAEAPARPMAPPAPPPRATPVPPPVSRRAVNPFLAQDPGTKARRLARALISDLVVYHPAKRADGLRDGSLKILFEEEIRKCWEEYTDQVGMEMASTTPFFTDALNEILADGRTVFP